MATVTKAKPGMEPEEGWGNVLGPTTLQRPERVTTGTGNDLPEATRYKITTPMTQYTGQSMGIPFQNGQAIVEDRDLAWRLQVDLGYAVEALS